MLRVSFVALLAACGAVADEPSDAQVSDDAAVESPATYRGAMVMTPPVTFGGGNFCTYTMTLRQIELEVVVSPSGELLNASAQNLNIEATVMPCPFEPAPPSLARYLLDGARSVPGGKMLTFRGDPENATDVALVIELSEQGTAFKGVATWKRLDQGPPLDWSVTATLSLMPE